MVRLFDQLYPKLLVRLVSISPKTTTRNLGALFISASPVITLDINLNVFFEFIRSKKFVILKVNKFVSTLFRGVSEELCNKRKKSTFF